MELKREIQILKQSKGIPEKKKIQKNSSFEIKTLVGKIREVVSDFNQIAAFFQKEQLSCLGGSNEEFEFQSPGSKQKLFN